MKSCPKIQQKIQRRGKQREDEQYSNHTKEKSFCKIMSKIKKQKQSLEKGIKKASKR
ncbi:MAG: hypothetical protein ACM3RX_08520 [Methanococcaceae archaeon]